MLQKFANTLVEDTLFCAFRENSCDNRKLYQFRNDSLQRAFYLLPIISDEALRNAIYQSVYLKYFVMLSPPFVQAEAEKDEMIIEITQMAEKMEASEQRDPFSTNERNNPLMHHLYGASSVMTN